MTRHEDLRTMIVNNFEFDAVDATKSVVGAQRDKGYTYTTICLRPRRGLRMNLRVRKVTGVSESAIFAVDG